jgi:chemotaxis protein methyltransferase CheR
MTLPRECSQFFARIIEDDTGIVYGDVNVYQLEARLLDVAKRLGHESPEAFWRAAMQRGMTEPERTTLLDAATNNETSFFRDGNVFKAVERIALDHCAAAGKGPAPALRIWSAACSTGQEVYSLTMLLCELVDLHPELSYSIVATDLSRRVLARASAGRYDQLEIQRGLSASRLSRFFVPAPATAATATQPALAAGWTVGPQARRGVDFKPLNLLEPWGAHGPFELILCRNVLIYQSVENKRKVISRLHDHLVPGGYLVLGGAESLLGLFDEMTYVPLEGAVVFQKKPAGGMRRAG